MPLPPGSLHWHCTSEHLQQRREQSTLPRTRPETTNRCMILCVGGMPKRSPPLNLDARHRSSPPRNAVSRVLASGIGHANMICVLSTCTPLGRLSIYLAGPLGWAGCKSRRMGNRGGSSWGSSRAASSWRPLSALLTTPSGRKKNGRSGTGPSRQAAKGHQDFDLTIPRLRLCMPDPVSPKFGQCMESPHRAVQL